MDNNIERYGFFASVDGDRTYTDDEFADYFKNFLTDGVFMSAKGSDLLVKADGTNKLKVSPGRAWIQGRTYELLEEKELNIEPGDALLSRIDLVVIRCDFVNRKIYATIKKGIEASSPATPTLQRDTDAWELAIAKYRIDKGVTNLIQSWITDTRKDVKLCGEVTSLIDKNNLLDFLKVTGFTMEGDMNTKNILPADSNATIGTTAKPYKKIVTEEIDIINKENTPFLSKEGGTLTGILNSASIVPDGDNTRNLGLEGKKWANAHIQNLHIYGENPFFKKTGGNISGAIAQTVTPAQNWFQFRFTGFDNNGQGDGYTYIGLNKEGKSTHMFRGLGEFTVDNPVANFQDIKTSSLMLNGKRVYIQSTAPVNAPEGSVWIKI